MCYLRPPTKDPLSPPTCGQLANQRTSSWPNLTICQLSGVPHSRKQPSFSSGERHEITEGDYICSLFDLKCGCERAQRGQVLVSELVCSPTFCIEFILLRSLQWSRRSSLAYMTLEVRSVISARGNRCHSTIENPDSLPYPGRFFRLELYECF